MQTLLLALACFSAEAEIPVVVRSAEYWSRFCPKEGSTSGIGQPFKAGS